MTDQEVIEYLKNRNKTGFKKVIKHSTGETIEKGLDSNGIKITCPECHSNSKKKDGTNSNGSSIFKCKSCGKRYGITKNTIFEGTDYTWDEMISLIHLVVEQHSIPYIKANFRKGKVSKGAIWTMVQKILYTLAHMDKKVMLEDVIQIDEKFFREDQKGSHHLESYVEPGDSRYARRHKAASKCGIMGAEFVNVVCAVDNKGHYYAKCVCLGQMEESCLDDLKSHIGVVSYVCTDNNDIYRRWVKSNNWIHYVEPSTYRLERKARGYIDTDDVYKILTAEEYALDKEINKQMYKEKRYPHLENTEHKYDYDEFIAIKYKFGLGINGVNSFHNRLEKYLTTITTGVGSQYLENYIGAYVYCLNWRNEHKKNHLTKSDAEQILCEMIADTLKKGHSITKKEIESLQMDLPRPSLREIRKAKRHIKDARQMVEIKKTDKRSKEAYEGDDDSYPFAFNKHQFFWYLSGKRRNELIKEFGLYVKGAHKKEKVQKLSDLPNAQDIIFREIYLQNYGSVEEYEEATKITAPKKKRGRPKKKTP